MFFNLIHLKIEKKNFKPLKISANDNRKIILIPNDYDLLMKMIKIVGGDSGWHLRNEYSDPAKVQDLKKRLQSRHARLFIFKDGQKTVGFCQILNTNCMEQIFGNTPRAVEIYKFGLFPDSIGQGRGQTFLSAIFEELFKVYGTIYLNTRDTNKVKSVGFYQRMGMQIIAQETKPSDLIPQSELGAILKRKPSNASSQINWHDNLELERTSKA